MKTFVLGKSANGEAEFFIADVAVSDDEYALGMHYDRAIEQAREAGFEQPFIAFDEKDQATYAKVLQSDSESVAERCTAKSTVYTASLAAGMVTKTIKNIMLKQAYPRVINWDISKSSNAMDMHQGGT